MSLARLAMLHAVAVIISSGLSIIGASAPKEMR
ncbi:MAG: DALR anticodon-binding domain-containing protein [Nitratireductor sp.]